MQHSERDLPNPFAGLRFLRSLPDLRALPADRGLEVAFAGRSNAGKSSAINAITGQKALARTSKTPGRTRHLVFFALDPERRLVDLPGYGFARVPEAVRRHWGRVVRDYLEGRRSLRGLVLVMDIRHPLTAQDRQLLGWCRAAGLPAHILLTKADKLRRGPGLACLRRVQAELAGGGEAATDTPFTVQLFSARTGQGVAEARARLAAWLELPEPAPGERQAAGKGTAPPALRRRGGPARGSG